MGANSRVDFMLLNAGRRDEVTRLLERIKGCFRAEARGNPEDRFKLIISGMPNVGKSTLINRLRAIGTSIGGKAVRTGSRPGVTRALSEVVQISPFPRVYMMDTPGVLMPKISDPEVGMRIALTGGMLDSAVGEYVLAEYLLRLLNSTGNTAYVAKYGLAGSEANLDAFLPRLAARLGLVEHGQPNIANTIAVFLKHFRRAEFGRFTLDPIPGGPEVCGRRTRH